MNILIEIIGWTGFVGLVTNYYLLSQGKWNATSVRSLLLNGYACAALTVNTVAHAAWPVAVVNISLLALSVAGLIRARRTPPPAPDDGTYGDHENVSPVKRITTGDPTCAHATVTCSNAEDAATADS